MQDKKAAAPIGRGEVEWIIAGLGTATLGALFRHLRLESVTTAQLMLLRYCGHVLMGIGAGVATTGGFGFLRLKAPVIIVERAIAVFAAAGCVVMAQGLMPVTSVIAIGFVWPVLLSAWSAARGEHFNVYAWLALALCLSGVFVETGMSWSALQSPGVLWMLGASVANAINARLGIVALRAQEPPLTAVTWTGLIGLAGMAGWWLVQPSAFGPLPSAVGVGLPVSVVIVAGIVQFMQTSAFMHSTVARLMPLTYVQLIWAVIADILVFAHYPDSRALSGIGLILCGVGVSNVAARKKQAPSR